MYLKLQVFQMFDLAIEFELIFECSHAFSINVTLSPYRLGELQLFVCDLGLSVLLLLKHLSHFTKGMIVYYKHTHSH